MPIDVRIPIGGLFLAVGALLLAYGVIGLGVGSAAGRLNAMWGGSHARHRRASQLLRAPGGADDPCAGDAIPLNDLERWPEA